MRVTACVVLMSVCLAVAPGVAAAEDASVSPTSGLLSGDPLVLAEGQQFVGGGSAREAEEVKRSSPEAVVARKESQTKYEHLSASEAAGVAKELFPALVSEAEGGPPKLPAGQTITGYPADDAAQVDLGDGKRGVIGSTVPIAVEASPGQHSPIDLSLAESGGVFEPVTPFVGVQIPKQLGEGVRMANSGVSLTPVDGQGVALGGSEGTLDGKAVFFANTQTDSDTLVKAATFGFETDTLLRSVESPEQLSFRVGLPEGASLTAPEGGSGPVRVVKEGATLAEIPAPSAVDAEGTAVPLSVSVSGSILTLSVNHRSREYRYPISVDPQVVETDLADCQRCWGSSGWAFYTPDEGYFYVRGLSEGGVQTYQSPTHESYIREQWAYWYYYTQGASRIYAWTAKTHEEDGPNIETRLYMASKKGLETSVATLPASGTAETTQCVKEGCAVAPVVEGGEEKAKESSTFFEDFVATSGSSAWADSLTAASVDINQETGPSTLFAGGETVEYGKDGNALYGGRWSSGSSGSWAVEGGGKDPGLGVSSVTWSSPSAPHWGTTRSYLNYLCAGVQCLPEELLVAPIKGSAETLPEGEDTIEVKVADPVGLTATTSTKVKVDNAPPHGLTLSGLPSTHEISDGQHFALKAGATSALAGMASLYLTMDGQVVGTTAKGCSPGPCTANGEWTLSGEGYAAGKYSLDVVAVDNAGNVTTEEFQVTIHHAAGVAVGPGAVNPVTGELSLSATDVSLSAPDGVLTASRGYRSRHLAQGTEGPLGPQWFLALGNQQSLSKTASGSMVLTGSGGSETAFASNGKGGYTSPAGDAGLVLSESGSKFLLSENGAVTTFARPSGSSGNVWTPSISEGAGGTSVTTFSYALSNGVIEPTEELAPVPSGVSCSGTLKKGCRALKFEYAGKETKAPGEGPSEWGEYAGHLSKITYTAWNPAAKEMKTVVVAQYAYDKQGRLRAEWNPTVEPFLKTIYGYDAEGHVTAVSAPGAQPQLLEQGTAAGDGSTGRLLAVNRPAASSSSVLKEEMAQATPANTTAPTLSSTTAKVGVQISVSSAGVWNNKPLAYAYQWQDCNSSGKECTAIPGAVNQAYYPVPADEGHTLVARVTALNATGAASAASAATSTVAAGTPNTPLPEPPSVGTSSVTTVEYGVALSGTGAPQQMGSAEVAKWGQTDIPNEAMAVFPPDMPMGWPAKEYTRATVYYLDGRDREVNTAAPTGGVATVEYNLYNDVTRTLSADNRAAALAAGEKSSEVSKKLDTESTYEEKGSEPGTELLSTLGPQHTLELAGKQAEGRQHTTYSYNEGAPEGGPYHLVTTMKLRAVVEGVEETPRTTVTSYSGQNNLGWKLRKPTSVTIGPSSLKLTHSTFYEPKTGNLTETRMPAAGAPGEELGDVFQFQFGKSGSESGQLKEPQGIAVTSSGNEYVLDTANSRVEEFNTKDELILKFGSKGTEKNEFNEPRGIALDSEGNVWVADTGNNRIEEFSASGTYINKFGTSATLKLPQDLVVNSEGDVFVADTGNSRIKEWAPEKIEETTYYNTVETFGTKGSGEEQFNEPQGLTFGAEGNLYVVDTGNNRIDEYATKSKEKAKHVRNFGKEGTGNGQLKAPHGITTDSAGDVWVADSGNNRIEEFGPTGTFVEVFGKEGTSEGKLKKPGAVAIDQENNAWVADTANNNVQEWTPNGTGYGTGTASAHDTQTIYYTAGPNTKVTACGEHPEWANLPCQTQPAAQPEGSLPKLQVTTYTYNMWDELETTTNTSGTTTRTTTQTYDAAGRLKTSTITSSIGTALPTETVEYNGESGAVEKQSTMAESKTKSITASYNTLGELASYTDAAEKGATTSYEYDVDGRVKKINDGKGTETYTYSKTGGLPEELLNEYGTTKLLFTGTYDPEGNLLVEGYPNGMTATYTYSQVGAPVALEYKKTTHCTEEKEKCKWFKDNVLPSIYGQWASQNSTLSEQFYEYDEVGRLRQVRDTPVGGKGCTMRAYTYDADTNRTGLTIYEPNAKGECQGESGVEAKHTYDTADRLSDAGVSYNAWGDITSLPAADAGGKEPSEELVNTYYTDNQVASQTQNGETIGYNLDPAGRTIEAIASGKKASDTTSHYVGPGDSPAWTENTGSETTRDIPGINGTLAAIQTNTEAPELELADLHGDIVAKAYLSETATELAGKADTTEYGVPTVSAPAKYAWLGAIELPTELPSGVVSMGVRSYVPQVGRFLQPDPISGGSANAYAYTFGDPVNSSDPAGTSSLPAAWAIALGQTVAAEGVAARKAAEEAAAREAAEAAARAAAAAAAAAGGPSYAGGSEEWGEEEWGEEEWGEEEWGEEEVAFHPGSGKQPSPLVEEGLLFQPEYALQGSVTGKRVVAVCVLRSTTTGHPCIKYVSLLGELKNGVADVVRGAKVVYHGVIKGAKVIYHFVVRHAGISSGGVQNIACAATGVAISGAGFFTANPFVVGLGIGTTLTCAFVHFH